MKRFSRFTWTHYNYDQIEVIKKLDVKYLCFGDEICPTTGRKHMQGYLELKAPKTFNGVLKNVFPFNKLFISYGDAESNQVYTSKTGDWFEKGSVGKQGQRSDLMEINKMINENCSIAEIKQEFPSQYIRYHAGIHSAIEIHKEEIREKKVKKFLQKTGEVLRPWQEDLYEELKGEPDSRKIIWYVDKKGGQGKSWFTTWLTTTKLNVKPFENSASANIAYAFDGTEDVIIFDFCRKLEDMVNYSIIEAVKNGKVFSSKYHSVAKISAPPHVVIFANFEPKKIELSADKWDIRDMGD